MIQALQALPLQCDALRRTQQFIQGQWCDAARQGRHAVHDPSTGQLLASVPDAGADDARRAADAAHAAWPAWRERTPRERAGLLKRWLALVLHHTEDLARLMAQEMGKPLHEARGEVAYAASYIEWFAEEAVRSDGEILAAAPRGKRQMVIREPVGVVAAITPWNFPLAMLARKLAPALAAGCTVLAKPAEDTPLTALALAYLAEQAGFPPGVINVVTASRAHTPEVVDVWLADARVRKITFTGSTAVGKHLARQSADTLKKLSLELGGNAPFIVFDDADLDRALDGLMAAKFRNGGQTCVCPNRVYVQRQVYEAFAERLSARVSALRVGPPWAEGVAIGPMVNARAVDKIERHVQDALARGAQLLAGGERHRDALADGPHYYRPTVLGHASADMLLHQEETFGPVVALFVFDDEAEAIALANATPYGLAAYFYTRDADRIWRVAQALECGIVGINEGAVASEAAPFGGIKDSGYGREGSRHGLEEFMHTKYLCQTVSA